MDDQATRDATRNMIHLFRADPSTRGAQIKSVRYVNCDGFPAYWDIITTRGGRWMMRHHPLEPYYKLVRIV